MNSYNNSNMSNNDDDFPSLSSTTFLNSKMIKPKTSTTYSITNSDDSESNIINRMELKKTQFCKARIDGKQCTYGLRCNFAHSLDELNIQKCGYGSKCYLVIYRNNKYINNSKQHKNCSRIHPLESKEDYLLRLNKVVPVILPESVVAKCTKMCKNAYTSKGCSTENCTYAHKVDELVMTECAFGSKCMLVKNNEGIYENVDHSRVCNRIHPLETEINVKNRVSYAIEDCCKKEQEKEKNIIYFGDIACDMSNLKITFIG